MPQVNNAASSGIDHYRPSEVATLYLDAKKRRGEHTGQTERNAEIALKWFSAWCGDVSSFIQSRGYDRDSHSEMFDYWQEKEPATPAIEYLSELKPLGWQSFEDWLHNQPISRHTEVAYLSSLKPFLKYAEEVNVAVPGIYESVTLPKLSEGERIDYTKLDPARAETILTYLEENHPYSRDHAMFATWLELGWRAHEIRAIDVCDFKPDGDFPTIEVRHRPELVYKNKKSGKKDLGIKNGTSGERRVAISDYLAGVLTEYIRLRGDKTETFEVSGETVYVQPLFTSTHGRVGDTLTRATVSRLTCPTTSGAEEPCDCDACVMDTIDSRDPTQCEQSHSSHHLRKASMFLMRDRGVPEDVVSRWCDTSVENIRKIYDVTTKEDDARRDANWAREESVTSAD